MRILSKQKTRAKYLKQDGTKLLNKNGTGESTSPALVKMRKRIAWQAGLALLTVVLTIVIVFAMTAAWYTNIIQTSGLTFEAEAWGFDGEITVNTEAIEAGPGDDGLIELTVANSSDNISAISVNVSKARMADKMQQRLFFYVDTQLTRNDETMERVYLNNQESYTYTLFSNGTLTLTEELHNDAQLKWQWVYDVLGYYILGTWDETTKTMTVEEYLRPIEYDYDEATFEQKVETDANGNEIVTMELATVDGKTTPYEFIRNITYTDGYESFVKEHQTVDDGSRVYYKVDVDSGSGRGVYAYLCNYSEIELATQYDTELGKAAADAIANNQTPQPYEVQLTISAQKNKNSVVNVTSLAGLETAMGLGAADVIQLSSDITIAEGESLEIAKGQRIMLDLNGYEIVCESDVGIDVAEGGSLNITGGEHGETINGNKITAAENAGTGIRAIGAEVVLSDVRIAGFDDAIRIEDDKGSQARDSKVRLVNCEVEAASYALVVKGNGSDSALATQLIVEGCTIKSDVIGISGNGSDGKQGTDIQVINSTVIGNPDKVSVGIYHPQKDGTLTVFNSQISGYTGMTIKGGSVNITSDTTNGGKVTTVSGTGAKQTPGAQGSGSADTGDGIYIETNYGYDILLEISGASVITSEYSYSLQVYEADAENVTVKIYSGDFDEKQPDEYLAEGATQVITGNNKSEIR